MNQEASRFEELKKSLLDEEISAVHELGEMNTPESLELLLETLQSATDIFKRSIIQSLPVTQEIEPHLVKALLSGYEYVSPWDGMIHIDIVMKLVALKTPSAISVVRNWIHEVLHLDDSLRFYAFEGILSLSRINDIDSLELFRVCLTDEDVSIQSAAVHAVGRMKDVESVPILIELLSNKIEDPLASEHLICDTVAEALGVIGDERAIEPIGQMIERGETGMHSIISLTAIGKLGESGLDYLLKLLQTAPEHLRVEIAYSLGLIGNKRVVKRF